MGATIRDPEVHGGYQKKWQIVNASFSRYDANTMKRAELFFTFILLPLDYLALVAAGFAAYASRFHPIFTSIRPVAFDLTLEAFATIIFSVAFVWLLIYALSGLYRTKRPRLWDELIQIVLANLAVMAIILGFLFFSRELFESRFILLASFVFVTLFVGVERLLVRLLQRSLLRASIGARHVAIIGKNKTADAIGKALRAQGSLGYVIIAQFESFNETARKKLLDLKRKGELDAMLLADPNVDRHVAQSLLAFTDTEQLDYFYAADLFLSATSRTEMHTYGGIPIVEVKKTPLEGWGAIYKRLFDIVIALILILITLPLQIIITVALFLEQPGRVLFSRLPNGTKVTRIGEGGRPFHYFKFRSMTKNAHAYRFDPEFVKKYGNQRAGTPLFKLKNDPRVTPVGRILRKFSLDELPEFYLVLIGRMSLVGPRPHLPEEVERYKPLDRKVLTLKPGITGMAQVSGRADLDFEEEVRLDTFYIENWSPGLDLRILLKTPLVVLGKKGAY